MRRLLSTGAFAFGLYYLWNASVTQESMFAMGLLGVALLLEFAGAT